MDIRRSGCTRGGAAFTLIELLVVIVIIAVLASFLLPIFGRTKQQANLVKTMGNMKQMGVAMLSYANDHNYLLPNRALDGSNDPKWPSLLHSYLQSYSVYSSPIPDVQGKTYKVTDQNLFLNNDVNYTSYIYNGMNDVGARSDPAVAVRLNAVAYASETILLGIPNPQAGHFYMDLNDGDNNAVLNKKAFDAGSIYMFCDGSSRLLTYDAAAAVANTQKPATSGAYSDWWWLIDKSATSAIH